MTRSCLGIPLSALLLASCANDEQVSGTLDTPAPIGVLDLGAGGPFKEAIGFVADRHGGRIRLLALGRGRYLTDDPLASFFRGSALATGSDRLLSGVAGYAPDADTTTVIATDKRFRQVLFVPYVIGRDASGFLQEQKASLKSVTFLDQDASGDDVTVDSIRVLDGYTTTETWTATYNAGRWRVEGSRSGVQGHSAYADAPFDANYSAISFVIRGAATDGDQIVIETDAGIEELDLGGVPLAISMAPDQSRAALIVQLSDIPTLHWIDPAARTVSDAVALPADASPGRVAWLPDSERLFVADNTGNRVFEIARDDTITTHAMPFPVFDVAPLFDETSQLLYVARGDAPEVWVYDMNTQAFIDVNSMTPATDGMVFRSTVRGIEALPTSYTWQETEGGVSRSGRSVAVSLYEGRVVWMEEQTGCLVRDGFGPRTELQSQFSGDYTSLNFTVSEPTTSHLEALENGSRHVLVNPCGGLAKEQVWTLRFDRNLQAWEVQAEVDGPQQGLAYEDERYVSDNGDVSFVVRAGSIPSEDGWGLQFKSVPGILTADGNNDVTDQIREFNFDLPADPVVFHHEVAGEIRPFVAVAAEAADIVCQIDPTDGTISGVWD